MDQSSNQNNSLSQSIAHKLGFDGMTKEEQEAMVDQIGALLLKSVLAKCMQVMSEHDADELSLLIDSGAEEDDILLFLQDRVPNFDEIAMTEAERFRSAATGMHGTNSGEMA